MASRVFTRTSIAQRMVGKVVINIIDHLTIRLKQIHLVIDRATGDIPGSRVYAATFFPQIVFHGESPYSSRSLKLRYTIWAGSAGCGVGVGAAFLARAFFISR